MAMPDVSRCRYSKFSSVGCIARYAAFHEKACDNNVFAMHSR